MKITNKLRSFGLAAVLAIGGTTVLSAAPATAGTGVPQHAHVTYSQCIGPKYTNTYVYYNCWADWDWVAEVFWGKKDWYTNVRAVYYA